jgi:hypothetical protein
MTPKPTTAAIEAMAKTIETHVAENDPVTFAELMNCIPGFSAQGLPDPNDHCAMRLAGPPVLWAEMTNTAAEACWKLFDERRLCAQNTTWMLYAYDGFGGPQGADWLPLLLRPGRLTNLIAVSGLPFHAKPEELKRARRKIAKARKAGQPTPTLLEG